MKVATVGAGIAGLSCAFRLQSAGHDVVVYERDACVGGRMGTVAVGGFSIDVGANILLDNYERTRALVEELGIGNQWFSFCAGSGGILRERTVTSFLPHSMFDVLLYRGLSRRGRTRLLSYLWTAREWVDHLDFFDLSSGNGDHDTMDADSFVRKTYGDEIADWIVDAFVRTFHFHGAKRMSMKYFDALAALFLGRGGFETRGLRRYMNALPRALSARVPVAHTPAIAVEAEGSDVRVVFADREERFDAVVLATPAPVARRLLSRPSRAQRELLDAIDYSSTMMCAYRVPRVVARDFEGIWVPFIESRIICCCANETRKGSFDDTACVFVIGLHDEAAAELLAHDDPHVLAVVAEEWGRLFPDYRGFLHGLYVQRWPEALPVYSPGSVGRVARFWAVGQGDGNVWLCGDYLNHPWVEGSIRCGEKIARRIGSA